MLFCLKIQIGIKKNHGVIWRYVTHRFVVPRFSLWKINGWNLQLIYLYRKENDLKQTSMITLPESNMSPENELL